MKRIVRGVRTLNERAAELTAAAGQLPNRVVELREAMTATSGQLLNLKSDIQVNVADLKVESEADLGSALAEVAAHAPVFAQAGFLLDAVDLEISPVQRVIAQLVRYREVDTLDIQPLIQKHQQQPAVRAILSAILKARATVATIDIDGLAYHKLAITIGPVPSIRLCWRSNEPAPAPTSTTGWQPTPSQPLAGGTSFFGPPLTPAPTSGAPHVPAAPAPAAAAQAASSSVVEHPPNPPEETQMAGEIPVSPEPAATTTPPPAAPPPLPAPQPQPAPPPLPEDPLARFKVMPSLNRTP